MKEQIIPKGHETMSEKKRLNRAWLASSLLLVLGYSTSVSAHPKDESQDIANVVKAPETPDSTKTVSITDFDMKVNDVKNSSVRDSIEKYRQIHNELKEEYDKKHEVIKEEYNKKHEVIKEEYNKKHEVIKEEYDKKKDENNREYKDYLETLTVPKIEGYISDVLKRNSEVQKSLDDVLSNENIETVVIDRDSEFLENEFLNSMDAKRKCSFIVSMLGAFLIVMLAPMVTRDERGEMIRGIKNTIYKMINFIGSTSKKRKHFKKRI